MKVVQLVENGALVVDELTLAPALAAGYCRVRIGATGVCSSDIARAFDRGAYHYPLVMGHEFAGTLVAVGDEVSGLAQGDRVCVFPLLPCFNCDRCEQQAYAQCHTYSYFGSRCHGAYAQFLDVPAWNILKIPPGVAIQDAALVEPMAVALHTLKRLGLLTPEDPKGGHVALIGAGFIGLLMCKILKKRAPHMQVTALDRNAFKLEIARAEVSEIILLESSEEWSSFLAARAASFDYVIEATGVPDYFGHSVEICKHGGTVAWMGNAYGDLSFSRKELSKILRKEVTIKGVWNSEYKPKESSDDWRECVDLIDEGIHPSALVSHWITLDEVPETLLKMHTHKSKGAQFPAIKVAILGV